MRYAYQQDSLAGLEDARRGSLPRGRRRWTGSLSQRARASRRLPQAVFKISSYSHSAGAVWDRVNYVSREGELEAEGPNGERLEQGQLAQMVEDWNRETEERARRRYAMSAVVSFPKGVDEEKAIEAGRQFFREAFADNHDYVFAAHTDAKHFHLHVVVQAAGHDGKQIRLNRDDLQALRMLLAEKAREQGIELDASPRWARGEEKEQRSPRAVEGIERRGEAAAWEPPRGNGWAEAGRRRREAAAERRRAERPPVEEVLAERDEQIRKMEGWLDPARQAAWEALSEERAKRREPDTAPCQALEYARAAATLAAKIPRLENDKQKVVAVKGAMQLAAFSWDMPRRETDKAADIEEARGIVNRAARAVHEHIQGIESGAAKKEAIQAERRLTRQLKEYRQGQEKPAAQERTGGQESEGPGWPRGAEERRESAGAGGACQALEYARAAGRVAGQLSKLTTDQDRVAAVKGAAQLARFGWNLAAKDKGTVAEREEAREVIDRTERALRFGINRIEDPQAKRAAIQARQTLYNDGVKEYRAERWGAERQRRQEAEREEGAGRER